MTVPFELDSPGGRTPRGSLPRRSHSTEGQRSYLNADVRSLVRVDRTPRLRLAAKEMPGSLLSQIGRWRDIRSMSTTDARQQLQRLQAERLDAVDAGLGSNELYMEDLESDIAASRTAYVALAVTEIASLRAQLSGPQLG